MNTQAIIAEIDAQISKLQQVRELIGQGTKPPPTIDKRGPGRPKKTDTPAHQAAKKASKRVMSEEGKARIAAAQKKRWAAQKKAAK